MRSEREIIARLLGLNRVQMYMVDQFFTIEELEVVRKLVVQANDGIGVYRLEQGVFVERMRGPRAPAPIGEPVDANVGIKSYVDEHVQPRAERLELEGEPE